MDDLINRQDAIDALATYIHHVDRAIGTGKLSDQQCVESAHSIIDELPSAERKGKWIKDSTGTYPYRCNQCNKYSRALYDYCPNCGADMRGDEDERPYKQTGGDL